MDREGDKHQVRVQENRLAGSEPVVGRRVKRTRVRARGRAVTSEKSSVVMYVRVAPLGGRGVSLTVTIRCW